MKKLKDFKMFENESFVQTKNGEKFFLIDEKIYSEILDRIEKFYENDRGGKYTPQLLVYRTGLDQGKSEQSSPSITKIEGFSRGSGEKVIGGYSSVRYSHVIGISVPGLLLPIVEEVAKKYKLIPDIKTRGEFSGNSFTGPYYEIVLQPRSKRGTVKGREFGF